MKSCEIYFMLNHFWFYKAQNKMQIFIYAIDFQLLAIKAQQKKCGDKLNNIFNKNFA